MNKHGDFSLFGRFNCRLRHNFNAGINKRSKNALPASNSNIIEALV